jgi:hypothetical protein
MEHIRLTAPIMAGIRIRHTIAMAIQLMDGIRERDTLGRAPIGIRRTPRIPIRGQILIGYPMPDGVDRACFTHGGRSLRRIHTVER